MGFYIRYVVIWLLFMAMIALIALIVPKISKPIERWINEKRSKMRSEREEQGEQPSLAEFPKAADTTEEASSERAEKDGNSDPEVP